MIVIFRGLEMTGKKAVMAYVKTLSQNSAGMTGKSMTNIYQDN
jgi:hypothetical protein